MPMDAVFDARQFKPQQGGSRHPVGNKFQFKITSTEVKDTKENTGKYFEVELTSPVGSIKGNYNLWNSNKQTVDIALGQLSALCHVTGIFNVDFKNDGKALMNGQGLMDVGFQKGHEPSAEKPEGGYVEIKKIYDLQGNEPGKAPATPSGNTGASWGAGGQQQPQQPSQQQQPNTAQGQGPTIQSGWGQPNTAQNQQAPNPANNTPAGGASWQQGGNAENPPWGK